MEQTNKTASNKAFFGPILKITLVSMLGTAGVGWGIHLFAMHSRVRANEQSIAKVQYRIDQIHEYENIYKSKGHTAAIESLKTK